MGVSCALLLLRPKLLRQIERIKQRRTSNSIQRWWLCHCVLLSLRRTRSRAFRLCVFCRLFGFETLDERTLHECRNPPEEPGGGPLVCTRMKSIGTSPASPSKAGPELIPDKTQPKPAGRSVGELVSGNQTTYEKFSHHEAHWREHHPKQAFSRGRPFEEFHSAYRAGYEGYSEFGENGKSFDETETKLRERYESENGSPQLPWTLVRPATHAAWHHAAGKK